MLVRLLQEIEYTPLFDGRREIFNLPAGVYRAERRGPDVIVLDALRRCVSLHPNEFEELPQQMELAGQ